MNALAERILARTGSRSSVVRVPYDEAYEKGFEDMLRRVPSIAKIGAAIGWAPTIGLDQTLDEVIAYFGHCLALHRRRRTHDYHQQNRQPQRVHGGQGGRQQRRAKNSRTPPRPGGP